MGRPEKKLAGEPTPAALFGAALRDLRHAAGLSQTELAASSSCVPATVGQVERARFLPSLELVMLWERLLRSDGQLRALWEAAVLMAHASRSRPSRHGAEEHPAGG